MYPKSILKWGRDDFSTTIGCRHGCRLLQNAKYLRFEALLDSLYSVHKLIHPWMFADVDTSTHECMKNFQMSMWSEESSIKPSDNTRAYHQNVWRNVCFPTLFTQDNASQSLLLSSYTTRIQFEQESLYVYVRSSNPLPFFRGWW